jgi:hypothetical protein
MHMTPDEPAAETFVSIGILAGHHEEFGMIALTSLFKQSLFAELSKRNLTCEIICVLEEARNTAKSTVEAVFQTQVNSHEHRNNFACHMISIPERKRSVAWNAFVHSSSEASSKFLFLIDGDVVLHHPDTLWHMLCALLDKRDTVIAVDEPVKDLAFKPRLTWFDKISLAVSHVALAGGTILPEQLYAIRADVARNIYLPQDLPMEGRFLAAILSTDYLTKAFNPQRIIRVPEAAHTFQAHRSLRQILQARRQRMLNRTVTYVLVEHHLRSFSQQKKLELGLVLMQNDEADPHWLTKLVETHIRQCHCFWHIFPDAATIRLKRLHRLSDMEELRYLPVGYLDQLVTLLGCWLAYRSLKRQPPQNHPAPVSMPSGESTLKTSP